MESTRAAVNFLNQETFDRTQKFFGASAVAFGRHKFASAGMSLPPAALP
jgi:hypothetical protein